MKPQGRVLNDFMRSSADVQIIRGPLGSGKTVQCCQKVFRLMTLQAPNREGVRLSRWYAVRNTYSDLFDTTIKDWLALWGEFGDFRQGSKEPPNQQLRFELEDGTQVQAEMIFMALDRPDHVKKLRGVQSTGFWMNEVKELSKAVFDMADLRHGRYPSPKEGIRPTWHGIIGDTNSYDEDHWLYKLDHDVPEGWAFFHQPGGVIRVGELMGKATWRLNENAENLANLPYGYYERGMRGKSDPWIAVNLANEYGYVIDGKPVYPEFAPHFHLVRQAFTPPAGARVVVGVDFGLTPAAAFGYKTVTGAWRWFHELVATDMGAVRFGELLSAEIQRVARGCEVVVWCDPAGDDRAQTDERTPIGILQAQGIPALAAPSNDPVMRREAVASTMTRIIDGAPGCIIDQQSCPTLAKALAGGYCYKRLKTADEKYRDVPDKNEFSHVAEAMQYAVLGEGENPKLGKFYQPAPGPIQVKGSWSVFD